MCGIFGTITNDVKNIDLTKIHLLGVLNEERGTDSCGLFLDGEVYAGFNKELSTYRNFAVNIDTPPKNIPVVLGHTRQASFGAKITIENVHPFGFGKTKDKGYEMVGAHNGTLYNKVELAKTFGVDVNVETVYGEREKIDSEILLECIYKSKNFKVLEQYHGAAALTFYDLVNNKMYLYSGASGNYSPKDPVLERPLHVYLESDEILHYSSECMPLYLIGGDVDNVFQIENNYVYEFTPGDFNNYKKHPVDRSKMTQKKDDYYGYGNTSRYGNYGSYGYGNYGNYDDFDELPTSKRLDTYNNLLNVDDNTKFKKIQFKYFKSIPPLSITSEHGITYSISERYMTNEQNSSKGQYSSGIYIFFDSLGYYKIADSYEELRTNMALLDDNFFNMKTLRFENDEANINWAVKDSAYFDYFCVPTSVKEALENGVTLDKDVYKDYFHYFYDGYKLESFLDYSVCLTRKVSFKDLSYMVETVMLSKENVAYKNGKKFTGTFENLYYKYTFKEGKCELVELKEKIESFTIFNYRYE